MATKRVPREITNQKDIDELLSITEENMTLSFFMEMFGEFNEKVRFNPYDYFQVPAGSFGDENHRKKIKKPFYTGVGIWMFNKFFIEKDLADFVGYQNYNFAGDDWEDLVTKVTRGVLEDQLDSEVLCTLLQKAQKIMPLSTPFTPSISESILMISQTILPKKKELEKRYAKELEAGDALIAEKMRQELIDYAIATLGDDPALDIYLSQARSTIDNHFGNMYVMKGAMRNPDPTALKQFNIATSCYNDGISKEDYPKFCNSLSAGPYSRAKKTEIGGLWEKYFISAYQHLTLDKAGSDCGTTDYLEINVTEKEMNDWMYSYVLDGKELVEINSSNYKKYCNKPIKIRFAALCESKTGFCNKCAGNLFYKLGVENIGLITMQMASKIKNLSMKAFHDSVEKTIKMNVEDAFGE